MTNMQWAIVAMLAICIGLVLFIVMRFEDVQQQPDVQRKTARIILEDHAKVIRAFRQAHGGAWPKDLITIRGYSKQMDEDARLLFTSNHVPHTNIFYKYRPPVHSNRSEVIMAAPKPNPIGESEVIQTLSEQAREAWPAVHFVLMDDLQVHEVPPSYLQNEAPWVLSEDGQPIPDPDLGDWQ